MEPGRLLPGDVFGLAICQDLALQIPYLVDLVPVLLGQIGAAGFLVVEERQTRLHACALLAEAADVGVGGPEVGIVRCRWLQLLGLLANGVAE